MESKPILHLKSFARSLSFHLENCSRNPRLPDAWGFFWHCLLLQNIKHRRPRTEASFFPLNNCIMLSFSLTAGMQNSPLNYWPVSNSLTTYCFLTEKYPPKPIKVYISFDLDNISRPLFHWQIRSFVQWTLTRELLPWSWFSICFFTHFCHHCWWQHPSILLH